MIRKVVFYTGRVQGVGFRFTAQTLAKRYSVAGYVRNLDDGRVRLDVQGESSEVDGLIGAVGQAMAHYIKSADAMDAPLDDALGEPTDPESFGIRY